MTHLKLRTGQGTGYGGNEHHEMHPDQPSPKKTHRNNHSISPDCDLFANFSYAAEFPKEGDPLENILEYATAAVWHAGRLVHPTVEFGPVIKVPKLEAKWLLVSVGWEDVKPAISATWRKWLSLSVKNRSNLGGTGVEEQWNENAR